MKKETLHKIMELMIEDGYLIINTEDKTNNVPCNSGKDMASTGVITINYYDDEKMIDEHIKYPKIQSICSKK